MATTFGVSTGDAIRPYGVCEIDYFPEAASQTFKRGYPIIMDSASTEMRVKVASADPTAAIVGIAAEDASGTTGNMVGVYLAKPENKFLGRAIASDACDFTDRGSARALEAHASIAVWVVDTTDAGADSVVVEKFLNPITRNVLTAEGDFEVGIVFHFDPKATIFGAGT
jgi:hypothetical protein